MADNAYTQHSTIESIMYDALRIVAAFLFIPHGGQKLLGWFGGMGPGGATVPLMSQFGLAGVIELGLGILLLLGLFTRPAAFIASGEMAVAYFQGHFPNGFLPIVNHGEPAVLFCFIWLFFAAHGAGRFSLDYVIRRRRQPASL